MDFIATELHKIEIIGILACTAYGVIFVLLKFGQHKSFIALVTALLTAGILVWGVNNLGWFRKQVGKETGQNNTRDFGKIVNTPIMNPPGMVVILTRGRGR